MRGQALKGHLDLLLLAILADGARHGYAIIDELRQRSDDAFDFLRERSIRLCTDSRRVATSAVSGLRCREDGDVHTG
jgi:hypothetical protein